MNARARRLLWGPRCRRGVRRGVLCGVATRRARGARGGVPGRRWILAGPAAGLGPEPSSVAVRHLGSRLALPGHEAGFCGDGADEVVRHVADVAVEDLGLDVSDDLFVVESPHLERAVVMWAQDLNLREECHEGCAAKTLPRRALACRRCRRPSRRGRRRREDDSAPFRRTDARNRSSGRRFVIGRV